MQYFVVLVRVHKGGTFPPLSTPPVFLSTNHMLPFVLPGNPLPQIIFLYSSIIVILVPIIVPFFTG